MSLGLLASGLGNSLFLNQFIAGVFTTGVLARDLTATLVYERALRLRPAERRAFPDGLITTMQSADAESLLTTLIFLHNGWASPLMTVACILLLFYLLGPAALAGVAVMALLAPVETAVAKMSGAFRKKTLKQADKRLGILGELLAGIKASSVKDLDGGIIGREVARLGDGRSSRSSTPSFASSSFPSSLFSFIHSPF